MRSGEPIRALVRKHILPVFPIGSQADTDVRALDPLALMLTDGLGCDCEATLCYVQPRRVRADVRLPRCQRFVCTAESHLGHAFPADAWASSTAAYLSTIIAESQQRTVKRQSPVRACVRACVRGVASRR